MSKQKLYPWRICAGCNAITSYKDKRGIEVWHWHDGHRLCESCFNIYVRNPVYHEKWNHITNTRQLLFKNKRILLKENPRKGVCQLCGKKNGEKYTNYKGKDAIVSTHIHHIRYDDIDPLKDTMELCNSCHLKETNRNRKNVDKGGV